VLCCDGERGLLSIAPAPDFHSSDRLYVAYTGELAAGGLAGDVHIDSFRHSNGALVREPVLSVPHSLEPDQNGGQVQFGPEGGLYASFGDGGGDGDPFDNAQDLQTPLGKLIRVYPYPGDTPSYVVPGDNPFVGKAAFDEIWSLVSTIRGDSPSTASAATW
jgi:glucose/arabinose dehydrogenase